MLLVTCDNINMLVIHNTLNITTNMKSRDRPTDSKHKGNVIFIQQIRNIVLFTLMRTIGHT